MAFYSRGRRPLAEEEKSTDAAKARTRAMELLAGQELSSGQLYERLNRRYTQQTSAAVVSGEDPELEAAAALVEGHYRKKLEAGRRDLVIAALQRRGFSYSVIKEAIRRIEEE